MSDPAPVLSAGENWVPLIPILAAAGHLADFSDAISEYDCEKITSPVRGVEIAVPVYGESMTPEFPSGSIVFVKRINERAFIVLSARKEQIKDGRFEYRRSKVGSLFSIKVEPEAQEIIERHRGENYLLSPLDRYKDYKDYLHHLNAGLKKIGAERGKNNKILTDGYFPGLSTNWARHTWASIGINLDIPKETISRGMGHGYGLSVTDIYIDFDMKKVDEANRKIIDAICR